MKLRCLLAMTAIGTGVGPAETPATDLIYGHYEIHMDYAVQAEDPDAGWTISTSYNRNDDFNDRTQVVRMDPGQTVFVAGPAAKQAISPALSRFGAVGDPIWVLPQNFSLGTPYLGLRTTMTAGVFQARVGNHYTPSPSGSISLRLISVEGSGPDAGGHFGMWEVESLGQYLFPFDTSDGIDAKDEVATIPVSSHTHYSWGMTKPGVYRVTFEVEGKLNPQYGNGFTSARQTFVFAVPFSSVVGEGAELRISPGMSVGDPENDVAYAPDRVFLAASVQEEGPWPLRHALTASAPALSNGVGILPEAAAQAADGWEDLRCQVLHVRGPGSVVWQDDEGSPLDLAQGISLDGGARNVVGQFSARGIYRVTWQVSGTYAGERVTEQPVVLTYGAGVAEDFSYAEWAASFEAAAGLAQGSLADPAGDADGDGLPNGAEYALFWQGVDPTLADAWRLPRPHRSAAGAVSYAFLRDTWKDPLNETRWQIRVETSRDLRSWIYRTSRLPGLPLETFETGAEEGNAWGRILKRRLRVMEDPLPDTLFFRFHVQSSGS